jgi:hypothetical protein
MIEQLILFLALVSAGWILSNQVLPLEQLKSGVDKWFNRRQISRLNSYKWIREYVYHLLNCPGCCAFWLILFIMGWQYSLIGYVIANVISRYLDSISLN